MNSFIKEILRNKELEYWCDTHLDLNLGQISLYIK